MPKPLLIYDGECAFCLYWVNYWQKLTRDIVRYQPYQIAAQDFPHIPLERFRDSIWLVEHDGRVSGGAQASFRVLSHGGKLLWLWVYQHIPGFAPLAERLYDFVAARRGSAFTLSKLLWGSHREPVSYRCASWLFLRVIGLIYVTAFGSFASQAHGLVGEQGILPLQPYLRQAHEYLGAAAYWRLPTLFWLDASDSTLRVACIAGLAAGLLVALSVAQRLCLVLCFALYLSLFYAGQEFMSFQWDLLLLESGFLAIFLPLHSPLIPFLFRWLLFRFMFLSGSVKLLSHDPSWANLSALQYHFETQPLPTWVAWYAHQLPEGVLRVAVLLTFVIELPISFLYFCARRPRLLAAAATALLQVAILITGNYSFFNLLTLGLCVFLLEDRDLKRLWPQRFTNRLLAFTERKPSPRHQARLAVFAGFILFTSVIQLLPPSAGIVSRFATALVEPVEPFRIVNPYGLFAVMTTTRLEIIIEGSMDGKRWVPYEFRYKPGDLRRPPGWNIPHQPRLDWQMWFAALDQQGRSPWFSDLLFRLLQNQAEVVNLLRGNPFAPAAPRFVRAQLYHYAFADAPARANGQWWVRRLEGMYYPMTRLEDYTLRSPRVLPTR
ncbi:MAG: lipase maturation factor family protein [Gammaproteobacteria bacterium]